MFRLERNLVDCLVPGLEAALRPSANLYVATEVTNRTRVVDIVLADAVHPKIAVADWADYAPGFRKLDGRKVSLLAVVWRERCISVDRLARITWTCPKDLASDVEQMVRLGLVEINHRRTLRPTGWAEWSPGSLIAVEAKLSDWRGAVSQALDHLSWADYSYVAMPANSAIATREVQKALRQAGVGGLAVDSCSQIAIRPKARHFPRRGAARERMAIGLLCDILLGSQHWNTTGAA